MDRLLLQLPLESSVRHSERSVGTPAPLADLRRLDESATLHSIEQFSEDNISASMGSNVHHAEDSNSARSSMDDREARSEWEIASSPASSGSWDEALTSSGKETTGISESLPTVQNSQVWQTH